MHRWPLPHFCLLRPEKLDIGLSIDFFKDQQTMGGVKEKDEVRLQNESEMAQSGCGSLPAAKRWLRGAQ